MITSNYEYLVPELMDVVRLFSGAEDLEIRHTCVDVQNKFMLGGKTYSYSKYFDPKSELERKSLVKRYAKLSLYELLSAHFQKQLPWGALTGIRPTRIAYGELEQGRAFEPLFREMHVSEENIELVRRTLEGQKGIYERKEGNCDLFISLPFCPTKCVYCSFITAPIAKTRQYISDYCAALERELSAAKPLVKRLRSAYIGGGTPFALEASELRRVLEAVAPLVPAGAEYTVEAGRPDVFTKEKLQICKDYGVTRICINAQSFSDKTLAAIGRKHTARQVEEAFALAAPYGFVVNCDLIAGLTDESFAEFCQSVDKAVSLGAENVTVHTLCLKKGARLKEEVTLLGEGELAEMIAYSRSKLTASGYEPYYLYRQKYMAGAHENVGWTKRGCASVYNIDVMEESADNFAVGANAISKKVIFGEGRIERIASPKDIPTYLQKVGQLIEDKNKLF